MPPKGSKAAPKEIDESQLTPGAIVLFRLRGYPPWPGLIITEEHVPSNVKKVKPQGNVFPLRFFPFTKPEYAWASPKTGEIQSILTKEDIDTFNSNPSKKGVSKNCQAAYLAAAEPVDLEKLKISEEQEQEDVAMEDVAEDEEEEEDAALEDIKDLYDDEEGTGKKRKRPATDDGEDQKPGRKKKSAVVVQQTRKRKSNKPEQNGSTERKKPGPKPKPKQVEAPKKKSGKEKTSEYRKKEIMYIRHRIQKSLLDKSGKEPDPDDLPLVVENLKKLADFDGITPIIILETKIHKVLKRIVALPSIPHDDTFQIKEKSNDILKSWNHHLEELNELAKKDTTEPKKGNGSDNEKPPVDAITAKDDGEPMEEIESGKPEEPKSERPAENETKQMEDVAKPAEEVPKPAEENVKALDGPSKSAEENAKPVEEPAENSSAMEVDAADDFVIVEGGGQGDELAQEKAAKRKSNGKDVGAGAQPSNDVSVAKMKDKE